MRREFTAKAATIDEAVEKGAIALGVSREDCRYEVVEAPRKGLFGKVKEATVLCYVEDEAAAEAPAEKKAEKAEKAEEIAVSGEESRKLAAAREYLESILQGMGLNDVTMECKETESGAVITFDGEGVAVLIGHHGETLDALQYLVALTCNRVDGEYYRITLDCSNYREKREATLRALAKRIGEKVKRTGRSQLLEPMNPYERRIIHAVVSEIDGISSKSKGEEPNRRVVILSDNPVKREYNGSRSGGRRDDYRRPSKPYKPEKTMEQILKEDLKEREDHTELYSKIEL